MLTARGHMLYIYSFPESAQPITRAQKYLLLWEEAFQMT